MEDAAEKEKINAGEKEEDQEVSRMTTTTLARSGTRARALPGSSIIIGE